MFSIIIPTFNNLEYLKLCIHSIKKNSKFKDHEIIFYINEGKDGTLDFLKNNNYKYIHSQINKGVCVAFNRAVEIATNDYVVLGHDDMYFCPGWDAIFYNELIKLNNDDFFLSGTMVQPFASYINLDCGKTYSNFNEEKLLKELPKIKFDDFQGTHWQPSLIHIKTWHRVGGFSEEFSPGLGSDPDFNMKLWNIGVRLFKGLSECRVYHFSSISLRKKAWNNGAKTFLLKWGISIKFFKKYYLRSDTKFNGILNDPKKNLFYYIALFKCKFSYYYLKILNLFKNV
tara:strand:+ start:80 stop:934 length:855 start_codon:yes stop_codon:yes gene_type:complete